MGSETAAARHRLLSPASHLPNPHAGARGGDSPARPASRRREPPAWLRNRPGWRPPASAHRRSPCRAPAHRDRKSTRLHSSHLVISYVVFCLKKKTNFISGSTLTITHHPQLEVRTARLGV